MTSSPSTPNDSAAAFPRWAAPMRDLRLEMDAWIAECIGRGDGIPWREGLAEGTFAGTWATHCMLTGQERVRLYLHRMRDEFGHWTRQHGVHGYWPEADAYHGPEDFVVFLASLSALGERDPATGELIEHAAHHIGNWLEVIPEWFDWRQHRFRSWMLGTTVVRAEPPYDFEAPGHFRVIQLALAAWRLTREEKYLQLSRRYADRWCQMMTGPTEEIPLAVTPQVSSRRRGVAREPYARGPLASASGPPQAQGQRVSALEPHVVGGTPDVLLDLYEYTREQHYAATAKHLLEPLAGQLSHPHAAPVGRLIRKYRRLVGDTTLDRRLRDAANKWDLSEAGTPLEILPPAKGFEYQVVGEHPEMVRWGRRDASGELRETAIPALANLMLAFEVTGNEDFATAALSEAVVRLRTARRTLAGAHGNRGVAAVVQGHERAIGAGEVTGTLYPAALGVVNVAGTDRPSWHYTRADNTPGLPETLAALALPSPSTERHLTLANNGTRPTTAHVHCESEGTPTMDIFIDGEPARRLPSGAVAVTVVAGNTARIVFKKRVEAEPQP